MWGSLFPNFGVDWNELEVLDYKDLNFCPDKPDVNEFDVYDEDCIVVHHIKGIS